MSQIRKGAFIRKVQDIGVGAAFALSLLSGSAMMSSCSSNNDNEADYSYEETSYTKGIRSHIKEVAPGEFKITDEEAVDADKSVAIVSYLDGHTDSLSTAASKALIDKEIQNNSNQGYHSSGLSSMLLYGGMGYMLGRNSGNSYINNYRANNPAPGTAYANTAAYSKSQGAVESAQASRSTRTVTSRPSGGRSGFFGRSAGRSGG
ncbi:hypothetical protein CLV98_101627 [Dyadobacter jejuensis]|uniref:UPF0323 domain-containing protein n=1 Tax=Dyadobacter jejuensis TaxID=1082580 RepID=A0A316ARX3_9BACT|nr:hypothetical protein [Dyadobacter jejuensis]PWJ60443.1 hypothetical protein CLV98_101627 [Dyadobacter jejuensis]